MVRPRYLRRGARQRVVDFVVGGLAELVVPEAHRTEGVGSDRADHLVYVALQALADRRRADGDGDDDARGVAVLQRLDRGAHRGARGQPVVDEDRSAAFERWSVAPVAVGAFASLQLVELARGDLVDHALRNAELVHRLAIEHAYSAARDGTHRILLVAGHAQLAHHENVERGAQRAGDLVGDGNAAARQAQDDDIGLSGVFGEELREKPPRLGAIMEWPRAEAGIAFGGCGARRGAAEKITAGTLRGEGPGRRQRAGFLEEVGGARHEHEGFLA